MLLTTTAVTNWNALHVAPACSPRKDQRERILAALGPATAEGLKVDQRTLARYYAYLKANLSLPLAAYYPKPTSPAEEKEFCCEAVELLDPTRHIGDPFDGLYCKTRKGRFEVNLPLVELHVPQDSADFQLIEDYCHWFWNWR